jgi:hypothetical protein
LELWTWINTAVFVHKQQAERTGNKEHATEKAAGSQKLSII